MRDGCFSHTGTGEVGVEVHALGDGSTGGSLIRVTGEQGEDVVAATVTALGDQAQIGGQSTGVGGTGGLIVGVGGRDVVGELSGALLDVALAVGLGVVLVILGHGLHLVDGVHGADHAAPWDTGEGVAGGANLTVNLETTAEALNGVSLAEARLVGIRGRLSSLTQRGRRSC